jgi:hypothetical protein
MRNLTLVFILFGLFLRIRQFLANRSLWLDEAMLALNIVNRSFTELTRPLDYGQGAPIGFLFIEKIIVGLFGNQDYILRLFPLATGMVSMFLIYKMANNYFKGTGVLVVSGLYAVSERLIYYASEVKQYSCDAMITLFLLLLGNRCLVPNANLRLFIAFGFASALSMWISHPAVFIITAVSISLTFDRFLRRDWQRLLWLWGILFMLIINFAVLYFVSLRSLAADTYMLNYWRKGFMPMPPWSNIAWFPKAFISMLEDPARLSIVPLSGAALFFGSLSFFVRKWQFALFLIMPFPIVLLVSGFEKYPFSERLLLFILPIVFFLIVEGIERFRLILTRINFWIAVGAWAILAVVLLYYPTKIALKNLEYPILGEHIKPVMSYVSERKVNGDLIYIYYAAKPAFAYYASLYGFGENDYFIGIRGREDPGKYIQDIDKVRGYNRVWFLFSHNCTWCLVNEELFYLNHLDKTGKRLDEFKSTGASVYLYKLSEKRK